MTRRGPFSRRARAAALACAALVWLAASPAVPAAPQSPPGEPRGQAPQPPTVISWPEPPAPARIQFVRALTPATHGGKPSTWSKIWNAITGGDVKTPQIEQPYGIALDAAGRVFVADTFARTIHVFDTRNTRYSAIHVDGDSLIGLAVYVDSLFVTDSARGTVTCLTTKGKRVWSLGAKAGFVRPTGLAISGGRLYVVDTAAAQVVQVDTQGHVIGRFGSRGGGPGQFNFPTNIAAAPDGRLFVADSMNFRVQSFAPDGSFLATFGQLGDAAGDFNRPKGIALDSDGHVYVVEGLQDTVQIFDEAGRFLLNFGESGAGAGQFWLPTGIAIRGDVIYVADAANRRVQVFRYLKERM